MLAGRTSLPRHFIHRGGSIISIIYCDVREGCTKQQVNVSHSEITSGKQEKSVRKVPEPARQGQKIWNPAGLVA